MMIPTAVDEDFRELAEWIASLGSENVKHLPGQHDQLDHGVRGSGDVVPPLPGTVPVPPGEVRLFHRTPLSNAASIRENGLTVSTARGETYGEPNQIWGSAGIRSSQAQSVIDGGIMDSDYVVVEFHMPTDRLNIGNGRDAAEMEAAQSDVTIYGDVPPENIIAVHEPWEAAYRTLAGPDYIDQVRAGEFDNMIDDPNFPGYSRALEILGRGGKAKYSPDQPRDDHGRFGEGTSGETDTGIQGADTLGNEIGALLDAGSSGEGLKVNNVARIGAALAERAKSNPALDDQLQGAGERVLASGTASWSSSMRINDDGVLEGTPNLYQNEHLQLVEGMTIQEVGAAEVAAKLQDAWSSTASNASPMSWALQLAAGERAGSDTSGAREFLAVSGITADDWGQALGMSPSPNLDGPMVGERALAEVDRLASSEAMRAYVDEVYTDTQEHLRELGVTEVTVFRGVSMLGAGPPMAGSTRETRDVELNPLSSFSLISGVAENFSGKTGYVFTATVPAERVFSIPTTGPGCLGEYEVVVVGGTTTVSVWSG